MFRFLKIATASAFADSWLQTDVHTQTCDHCNYSTVWREKDREAFARSQTAIRSGVKLRRDSSPLPLKLAGSRLQFEAQRM